MILYYIILYYIVLHYITSYNIIIYIYITVCIYINIYIYIWYYLLTMYYYVGRIFIGFRMPKTWVETTVSESRSFDPMVPLIGILKKLKRMEKKERWCCHWPSQQKSWRLSGVFLSFLVVFFCFTCFCQWTENCARKTHVFANVISQVM